MAAAESGAPTAGRIHPLPWIARHRNARPGISAGGCGDRRHQARRGRFVDPGDDHAMKVLQQMAPMVAARLHRAEAAGAAFVAAPRADECIDLALEDDGAQRLLHGFVGRLHRGVGNETPLRRQSVCAAQPSNAAPTQAARRHYVQS